MLVSDIGCNSKIMDYIGVNSFDSLHGRSIPTAVGVKLANPELTVVVHAGDGATFAEGLEHALFAAKRNVDLTLIVHDNGVYGLTDRPGGAGDPGRLPRPQSPRTAASEDPFNPLELLHVAGRDLPGARLLARQGAAQDPVRGGHRASGLQRRGHAAGLRDVSDLYAYYNERVYELEGHDPRDEEQALAKIREWDYRSDGPVALGTLSVRDRPVFGDQFTDYGPGPVDLDVALAQAFAELT